MAVRSTSKKVLQSFHARTTLWKLFEIKARELDCSIDYLINESMRLYATTHGFLDDSFEDDPDEPPSRAATISRRPNMGVPVVPRGGGGPRIPRPGRSAPQVPQPSSPSGRPPSLPRPGSVGGGGGGGGRPSSRRPAAPTDAAYGPGVGTQDRRPTLTLIFQGRKIAVVGDQFIIGRGEKASDLAIKDANISRKHAAIIYHNRTYYVKDLGSTNGIEYNGKQVDSKRIEEGDVFSICGYELHFTYTV